MSEVRARPCGSLMPMLRDGVVTGMSVLACWDATTDPPARTGGNSDSTESIQLMAASPEGPF